MTGLIDVSVVMPVGSIEPELDQQLAALAGQTHEGPWELVISLNAGSSDARASLDGALERFAALSGAPPVTVIDSSAVRSASHARNEGAAAAKGPWLVFCDSDDIADPGWLQAMVESLRTDVAVGGHLDEDLLAVEGQENWRPPATPGGNPTFLGHPYLVSANMAVHADAFHQAGGFDESLIRGEDIAFAWSLIRNGVSLAFAPGAVMHYRHRRGLRPMLEQHYLYGRGMSQILARHGTPDSPDGVGGGLLRANGQRVEKMNIIHVLRRGSIAAGRVVGLVQEKISSRSNAPTHPGRK